jgi:hypothetical protein
MCPAEASVRTKKAPAAESDQRRAELRGGIAAAKQRAVATAASSAALRCFRQVLRLDEYTPSRRSSAPTSPGAVQRSAASRIRYLSDFENDRRRPPATTSTPAPAENLRRRCRRIGRSPRATGDAPASARPLASRTVALSSRSFVMTALLPTNLYRESGARFIGTGGLNGRIMHPCFVSATLPQALRRSYRLHFGK